MTIARSVPDHPIFPARKGPGKAARSMAMALGDEPLLLPPRFAKIKADLISGKEAAVTASWHRLLQELRRETELVVSLRSYLIPTIDYREISNTTKASCFVEELKKRGTAVIRNVVPRDDALVWIREAGDYLGTNPQTKAHPAGRPQIYEIFWSLPQVKARAHPNVLTVQKFAMSCWRTTNADARITSNFPVNYADIIRIRTPGDKDLFLNARVDGGSVERWETDGYGRAGTYKKIFEGQWEEYDPWDSSTRLGATSDLYNSAGSCSVFRMFQGYLSLSNIAPGQGTLQVCPFLQLSTAYFLLRPFFSPKRQLPTPLVATTDIDHFLDSSNWTLNLPQTSELHGAVPSYSQELNNILHPHLQLDRNLVSIPPIQPGDYVIWHPDVVHVYDRINRGDSSSMIMYLPACPLTQTNALFLARQRKAFLLGYPSPDFEGGKGESSHVGRPGVQEVNDAGGEEALRAMGLLAWDEENANTDAEKDILALANAILFPDDYDMI